MKRPKIHLNQGLLTFFCFSLIFSNCSKQQITQPSALWVSPCQHHDVYKKGDTLSVIKDLRTGKSFTIPLFGDVDTSCKFPEVCLGTTPLDPHHVYIEQSTDVNCGFYECGVLDLHSGQITKPKGCIGNNPTTLAPMGNDLYLVFECREGPCWGAVRRWKPDTDHGEDLLSNVTDEWIATIGDIYYISSACNPLTGEYANPPPNDRQIHNNCVIEEGYGDRKNAVLWSWRLGEVPKQMQ